MPTILNQLLWHSCRLKCGYSFFPLWVLVTKRHSFYTNKQTNKNLIDSWYQSQASLLYPLWDGSIPSSHGCHQCWLYGNIQQVLALWNRSVWSEVKQNGMVKNSDMRKQVGANVRGQHRHEGHSTKMGGGGAISTLGGASSIIGKHQNWGEQWQCYDDSTHVRRIRNSIKETASAFETALVLEEDSTGISGTALH